MPKGKEKRKEKKQKKEKPMCDMMPEKKEMKKK